MTVPCPVGGTCGAASHQPGSAQLGYCQARADGAIIGMSAEAANRLIDTIRAGQPNAKAVHRDPRLLGDGTLCLRVPTVGEAEPGQYGTTDGFDPHLRVSNGYATMTGPTTIEILDSDGYHFALNSDSEENTTIVVTAPSGERSSVRVSNWYADLSENHEGDKRDVARAEAYWDELVREHYGYAEPWGVMANFLRDTSRGWARA